MELVKLVLGEHLGNVQRGRFGTFLALHRG
jgi:hypothetical protein